MISVIIPAHNAQATLAETLDSLLAQTFRDWEATVIDDGSTDGTLALAERFATQDARIRVIGRPHAGVSAARNAGLAVAQHEWVLFLDSDDSIVPQCLERLAAALYNDPALDIVHSDWAMVASDGTHCEGRYFPERGDPFRQFASRCAFPIHSCLTRRELIRTLGGFDLSLQTCEDWDLWQRIARTGAAFQHIPEALALYRMRPHSASTKGWQMLKDGLRVVARGHAPDPRVNHPAAQYAHGRPQREQRLIETYLAIYAAGLAIGNKEDPLPLLSLLGPGQLPPLDPSGVAQAIFDAVLTATACSPASWHRIFAESSRSIQRLLDELEARTAFEWLASCTANELGRLALHRAPLDAFPLTVGPVRGVRVEVTEPIPSVAVPASIDRLHVSVEISGVPLGTVALPAHDGMVPAEALADAIAAKFAWPILGRFFEATLGRPFSTHDAAGWSVFLQELWGCFDTPDAHFYDSTSVIEPAGRRKIEHAWCVLDISRPLPECEVSGETLHLIPTLGGPALGTVVLPVRAGLVRCGELRAAITTEIGFALCQTAVRHGVLGRAFTARPLELRNRLKTNDAQDASALIRRLSAESLQEPSVSRPGGGKNGEHVIGEPAATTALLPVLMYHHIAPDGASMGTRYRLSTGAFEEQLRYLRGGGFRSATLREWAAAMRARKPLPGRAVLLTFDDGYRDFLLHAWPLLKRYEFSATLFIVTDEVGKWNRWDRSSNARLPLLNWDEILEMRAEGLDIGSHTATHRPLTGLSTKDIVEEVRHSRMLLENALGQPVRAIAYPYGMTDSVVEHAAGAHGYACGLTSAARLARLSDHPLAIPRVEIEGTDRMEDFIRKLSTGY